MVESIGIVRDADNSAHSALQSVQSSLRNLGLPAPTVFRESAGTLPKVSIFVMPDNEHAGALEQLCLQALVDDPVMPCVAGFLQCVERVLTRPPENPAKAQIHAFLASREDPELRLGEAAQRGYIPWAHPAFAGLGQFLQNL